MSLLLVSAGACTDGGSTGIARTVDVEITGYRFPDDLEVATGGELVLTTTDAEPHEIQIVGEDEHTDPFGAGDEARLRAPDEPGEHELVCLLHPSMHGTIGVEAP